MSSWLLSVGILLLVVGVVWLAHRYEAATFVVVVIAVALVYVFLIHAMVFS